MKQKYLRDQRGVAMLLEVLLVAAVLSLAGLAVYQANQRSQSTTETKQATAVEAANAAAAVVEAESAADVELSAEAEASAAELSEADDDVTQLGGSSNASF